MRQTRIVNRPDQRLESGEIVRHADQEGNLVGDETNLTVASYIEGRFEDRKSFGRWVDSVNAKLAPKKGRR